MARRKLTVVRGGVPRRGTRKPTPAQQELLERWEMGGLGPIRRPKLTGDVIPILDGWIRKLEREAGLDSAANET